MAAQRGTEVSRDGRNRAVCKLSPSAVWGSGGRRLRHFLRAGFYAAVNRIAARRAQ